AVRAITVELGHDPKDFALLSFGGAGGLVAVDVARELGIPEVVVPPGQGAFSALGMLMADVQHDLSRTAVTALSDVDLEAVGTAYADLEAEAAGRLEHEGFGAEDRNFERSVDVRYSGQEHSVSVGFPADANGAIAVIEEEFAKAHHRQYGHVMDDPVEITTLRVRATGVVDKPTLPRVTSRQGQPLRPRGKRDVHETDGSTTGYARYAREDFAAGDAFAGPAVITEHTATTVLHEGDRLEVGPYGELVITLGKETA
ncbi:MAG: hydantoinase/oxoprolinase family protein, partial [Stackebrandtia sp.]